MAQQFLLTWVRLPLVSCQDVGSYNSDPGLPKQIVFQELVGSSKPTSAKGFSRQASKGQTKSKKPEHLGFSCLLIKLIAIVTTGGWAGCFVRSSCSDIHILMGKKHNVLMHWDSPSGARTGRSTDH